MIDVEKEWRDAAPGAIERLGLVRIDRHNVVSVQDETPWVMLEGDSIRLKVDLDQGFVAADIGSMYSSRLWPLSLVAEAVLEAPLGSEMHAWVATTEVGFRALSTYLLKHWGALQHAFGPERNAETQASLAAIDERIRRELRKRLMPEEPLE